MNLHKFEKELKKEYKNNFKEHKHKFRYTFKLRHAFIGILLMFVLLLTGEHLSVKIYNANLKKQKQRLYETQEASFIKLESKKDYNKIVTIKNTKTSFLSALTRGFGVTKADPGDAEMGMDSIMGPAKNEAISEDVTNTNVQVYGVDEADYSKCDGTYIYSLEYGNFYIFDLDGNKIIEQTFSKNVNKLYLYENNIILIGYHETIFCEFDGTNLSVIDDFNYALYNDSRLIGNTFYLIYHNKFDKNEEYEKMYYDQLSTADTVYSIIKYDLNTNEYQEVNNLNSGNVILYMTKNNIYLATNIYTGLDDCRQITVTSIFDLNLNPVAALKVNGSVLNQFSMDEYENYFRIVTTNTSAKDERLNAISIFDISKKELVGYLDEGIGIERQTVKSVRFDGNTCYIVTYLTTDPLYEIDLSDPTNPYIASLFKSPGYSSYLHTFTVNGEKYLFGIGYCDDQWTRKISVYKNDEETTQVGKDLIITNYYYTTNESILLVPQINQDALNDHHALFIYQKDDILYLGVKASTTQYVFFKIDVKSDEVISVYETITFENIFYHSRCYLINDKIYITNGNSLFIKDTTK